jgi:hypothetical protein
MKARRLIEGASYPPEVLAVLFEAFDRAWLEIETDFTGDAARENGRLTLASILLMLAREHVGDADELRTTALKLMAKSQHR